MRLATMLACGFLLVPVARAGTPLEDDMMVPLDGADPAFVEAGASSFPHAKARCVSAVITTFKNSGHGVERADRSAGAIVSRKAVVYRATVTEKDGAHVSRVVSNKFYVQVDGDEAACTVRVTKLRAWSEAVEVEMRTRRWVRTHLRGFMKGVEEELASPPISNPTGPGTDAGI